VIVWRICKEIYKDSSFRGEGGFYSSGRWHKKGVRIVYTAATISLATLEAWVHVQPTDKHVTYVHVSVIIPDDLYIRSVEETRLPPDWKIKPFHPELQSTGMKCIKAGDSAVLKVPSVVSTGEFNYLLNPIHSEFQRIRIGDTRPFAFDERMWKAQK
jgi:RES domain-containing protein